MMQNITNAVEFAASFSTRRYPASPAHICEQLGIIIVSDKHLSADGYLVCHNGKKLIFVNATIQNRHRQNFIISHELGHFLLHQQQLQSCKRISFQATFQKSENLISPTAILRITIALACEPALPPVPISIGIQAVKTSP